MPSRAPNTYPIALPKAAPVAPPPSSDERDRGGELHRRLRDHQAEGPGGPSQGGERAAGEAHQALPEERDRRPSQRPRQLRRVVEVGDRPGQRRTTPRRCRRRQQLRPQRHAQHAGDRRRVAVALGDEAGRRLGRPPAAGRSTTPVMLIARASVPYPAGPAAGTGRRQHGRERRRAHLRGEREDRVPADRVALLGRLAVGGRRDSSLGGRRFDPSRRITAQARAVTAAGDRWAAEPSRCGRRSEAVGPRHDGHRPRSISGTSAFSLAASRGIICRAASVTRR